MKNINSFNDAFKLKEPISEHPDIHLPQQKNELFPGQA